MTGYDIQRYEYAKEKAEKFGFKLETSGDQIVLRSCGAFATVSEVYSYLCGYEHGMSKGYVQGMEDTF